VLHNCVDLARFRKTGALAPSFNFVGRPTIFATVGTLGRGVNKRTDISIRALASARSAGANVALVICGDGEQRSELEELAAKLDVTSHVKFLGTCSDVPSVLRACDVFCHAAPWEPFGIVAIEAMAIGLPVILPKSGGIQEILRGGEGGLLYEALNHEALAQAMGQLAANRQLCEEMGAAGRRIVEQEFSAERYMQRLYEIYGIDAVCKERKGLGAHA
jgi:glycosyltransferase involved in cell wall biosynthesis